MVCIRALGSNSGGQLATGNEEDAHYLTKTEFSPKSTIDSGPVQGTWCVHGGGNHAFAWIKNGTTLLASGFNLDGELALGCESKELTVCCWTPVMIPGSYVQQVACGWNHTLLLNDLGQVYAAGSGTFGQLGIAGVPADGSIALGGWTQVPAPVGSVFVRIACGIRHSLALDQDGLVYGWGANRCGQLGIPPDKRSPNIPTMALVSQGLPPIAMIACGRSHSILVAQDRRTVFVAGQDKYAQCGPATSHMVAGTWRTFQLPRDAIKACSGWDFGAILLGEPTDGDEERGIGNVVVWGRGDHGQVAQRVENGCLRDLGYIAVAGVCDMVCGSSHVVALTQDGSVYMWGWNEHGNAGNPNLENIFTPLCVHDGHGNPDNRAVSIGCGYGNSYVVS